MTALSRPNVLIYSIARRPNREALFIWGGVIDSVDYAFYRLRGRGEVAPRSLADAKRYRVGVVRGDFAHDYLAGEGFGTDNGAGPLEPGRETEIILRELLGRHIDLAPFYRRGLLAACLRSHVDCAQFEPVLPIPGLHADLYFAFSRATDPGIIRRLDDSYAAMAADGTVGRLVAATYRMPSS